MLGARLKPALEKAAKERQKRKPSDSVVEILPEQKGRARDQAGSMVGVSGKSVDAAERVIEQGATELIEAVESGRIPVSVAAVHNRVWKRCHTLSAGARLCKPRFVKAGPSVRMKGARAGLPEALKAAPDVLSPALSGAFLRR